jgi:MFS transporter, DHA3 family, macrolide efflux protein
MSLSDQQPITKWKVPFFTLWPGQAFSLLGSQIVQFGMIWWLTRTTGSATVLATAAIVGLLPQVFLSPIAGALVDRWNRRITMMVADSVIALITLLLAFLFFSGKAEIWHIYLIMFVRSCAGSFHWPAMQASTSLMVPKDKLARIQGLNQMLNGGMNIASAPIGALLVEFLPMHNLLLIDVGTALLAVTVLFFIAVPQPQAAPLPAGAKKATFWQDFVGGLRYMAAWPGLIIIMIMATLINLMLNPGFALMPILITRHFGGQALELAWMQSTWSVGVVAGGLLLSLWGGFKRRVYTSMMGIVGIGLGCMAVGLMPSTAFYPALVAFFAAGLSNPIANGPLFAALQATVAPQMQGRVFTILISSASAMMPLGLAFAGPIADRFGVQVWFFVGGILTVLIALTGILIPAVRNFEDGSKAARPALKETDQKVFNYGD